MNRDERRDPERTKENIAEIPEYEGMRRGKHYESEKFREEAGKQIGEKPQELLREPGGRQALWYANRHHRWPCALSFFWP